MKEVKSLNRKLFLLYESKVQGIMVVLMVVLLVTFVALPCGSLFMKAFSNTKGDFVGTENFKAYFTNPSLVGSLKNSLFISIIASFISVILGFVYAYGISRTAMRMKKVFKAIAILPLFAPSMLYSISLIYLFGNKGIFTNLGMDIGLYGPVGIIISEVIFTFPQVFLILSVGLSMTDYRIYETAEALGTSKARIFFRITLPSIEYPLISSIFISFIMCFTDFGAPKVLGGNYNVLATDIYKQIVGQFNMPMGAVISIVMLLPVLLAFFIDRMASKKQGVTITSKSSRYVVKKNRVRDGVIFFICIIVAFIIISLIATAVIASLINLWPYDMKFTLKHYKFDGLMNSGWDTYLNSLKISILTALGGTIFTFITSYLIEKVKKYRIFRQIAYFLAMIPLALPGLVIGLSYIFFFNHINNPLNFIYKTTGILVLANIVHFYSVSFITSTTALKMLDEEYEVVAKSMKVPFYKLFFKVTVPMSIEAILEVAMYFFLNSMVTVSALIFLYTPKTQTASISILKLSENGDGGSAAAMAALILLTNIIVKVIYEFVTKKVINSSQKWKATEPL
jgi:iron(III) transport system permease protein